MRRAGGRYYPDVFKSLSPCVRDVVSCRWWNIRKHFLRQRHVGMSFDLGNATPVKYHQSFFMPRSRVPADALSRFELHRASPHPACLWSTFEQWAVAPGTVQGKSNRITFCTFLRRDDAEREGDTDEYNLNVPHGDVRSHGADEMLISAAPDFKSCGIRGDQWAGRLPKYPATAALNMMA